MKRKKKLTKFKKLKKNKFKMKSWIDKIIDINTIYKEEDILII